MEAGRARGAGWKRPSPQNAACTSEAGDRGAFFSPTLRFSRSRGCGFRFSRAAERAADLQNVDCPAGLAEEDAAGNLPTLIDGVAGRVDDGDIRAHGPKLLGDIPTGQIAPELDIGDDDIDAFPALQ